MSKLTELAAARMHVLALESAKCAQCGHTLAAHVPTQQKPDGCHAAFKGCKCKGFADEATEQMELT